jgi:hypothetical protein
MASNGSMRIAIVWRGDREARQTATPRNNRFYRIFEELEHAGITAEPAIFDEAFAEEVGAQLLAADGVLVWVDPLHEGKTRAVLDPLLRDVAARGPWVSAHPDVILKMGVKEVLHRTKHLGWGVDTRLYRAADEFACMFPPVLRATRPARVFSSRTAAMEGKAFGRSRSFLTPPNPGASCGCCMHDGAACLKKCRSRTSCTVAKRISCKMDVSSISRFSHACPMG